MSPFQPRSVRPTTAGGGASALADSALELARTVLVRGPVSRGDLARELKLSVASLTRLSKPLLDAGLIVEGELIADGTVGRPVRLVDIRSDSRHFLGVKIAGAFLQAVVTDLRATIVAAQTLELAETSVAAVVGGIKKLARDLGAGAGVTLSGVGVSLGGQVLPSGVVHRAPFLEWQDVPLGGLLAEALSLPVVVDNDLSALAAAEQWFGAGRSADDFAVITVGAGVGYGLVMRGQVMRTVDTGLGLGGHIPLDPNGPLCMDGHRGCSTAMLSSASICTQISAAMGTAVDYGQALALVHDGNKVAVAVFTAAARALGRFIALAANLAMVGAVVLGGEGIGLFTVMEATVREALLADRDPEAAPVTLVMASADFTQWARGAAAVAIQDQAFIG
ncbi:MAG: ROK family transcriptional regulator [Specibacter sp.]